MYFFLSTSQGRAETPGRLRSLLARKVQKTTGRQNCEILPVGEPRGTAYTVAPGNLTRLLALIIDGLFLRLSLLTYLHKSLIKPTLASPSTNSKYK